MVGRPDKPARQTWDWEPWEARRTSLPQRPEPDVREAREHARLLLRVVQARVAGGAIPYQHTAALASAAEDERLTSRLRLRAATALARMRMAGMRREGGEGPNL